MILRILGSCHDREVDRGTSSNRSESRFVHACEPSFLDGILPPSILSFDKLLIVAWFDSSGTSTGTSACTYCSTSGDSYHEPGDFTIVTDEEPVTIQFSAM